MCHAKGSFSSHHMHVNVNKCHINHIYSYQEAKKKEKGFCIYKNILLNVVIEPNINICSPLYLENMFLGVFPSVSSINHSYETYKNMFYSLYIKCSKIRFKHKI